MKGRIPQAFIDDLLERVDIVDVVDSRVKLKKTGKNYAACCPFHDEKTPSFTVTPDKQFYYCFGCGASGNALGFIMEYERLDFPAAVESLARVAGMEVPRENQRSPEQEAKERTRKKIYSLLDQAAQFYEQQLRQHPTKAQAVNYLKRRELTGQICKQFAMGYAPPGWDNLLKTLGTSAEERRGLLDAGLLIERPEDKKTYDRFRHRIMFPIRDVRGRVIGFGGRVLDNSKPKYLNSPETQVFHKGEELYGLYEARQALSTIPRLLVVEGYMDVVALAQFDIRYAVATLGTACGEEHLKRAFKYTNEVVFCFDGDAAGRSAARRALMNSLGSMEDGRQIRFLFLPEGEDPDTLVRQIGPEKFTRMVNNGVPLEEYLFEAISEDIDCKTMEGRARLSKRAAPLLEKLPKGVYRELMFDNLANRTGLSRDTLHDLTQTAIEKQLFSEPATREGNPEQALEQDRQRPTTQQATHQPQTAAPQAPQPLTSEAYQWAAIPEAPPLPDEEDVPDYLTTPEIPTAPVVNRQLKLVIKATALLLHSPELASELEIPNKLNEINDPATQRFFTICHLLKERPHFKANHIIGHWQGRYGTDAAAPIIELIHKAELYAEAKSLDEHDTKAELLGALSRISRELEKSDYLQTLQNLSKKRISDLTDDEKQQYLSAQQFLARL